MPLLVEGAELVELRIICIDIERGFFFHSVGLVSRHSEGLKAVLWGECKTGILSFAVASLLLKLGKTNLCLHSGGRVLVGIGAGAIVALHKACSDDLRIAQACAVEDGTDGVDGLLELVEVLTYVH